MSKALHEQLCKKNYASKNLFLLLIFCQHINCEIFKIIKCMSNMFDVSRYNYDHIKRLAPLKLDTYNKLFH